MLDRFNRLRTRESRALLNCRFLHRRHCVLEHIFYFYLHFYSVQNLFSCVSLLICIGIIHFFKNFVTGISFFFVEVLCCVCSLLLVNISFLSNLFFNNLAIQESFGFSYLCLFHIFSLSFPFPIKHIPHVFLFLFCLYH